MIMINTVEDSYCTGGGGGPGPKRSTHHRPSQVGGNSAGIEIPGLDTATTSSTSVHVRLVDLHNMFKRKSLELRRFSSTGMCSITKCRGINAVIVQYIRGNSVYTG